MLLVSVNK